MAGNSKQLKVRVLGPDKVIWEGEADAVSAQNENGVFDILPGHANFITICTDSPLIIHRDGKDKETFSFKRLAVYARQDTVSVYTEV